MTADLGCEKHDGYIDACRDCLRAWLDRKPPVGSWRDLVPPLVSMFCPVYGDDGCRHEYPGNALRVAGEAYCIGSVCVAFTRGERGGP